MDTPIEQPDANHPGQNHPGPNHADLNHADLNHEGSNHVENAQGPNVAVIAIHGVGQHLSGASADAVSTLLLSMGRENAAEKVEEGRMQVPPYSGFVSKSIDVPLRPVQAHPEAAEEANKRNQLTFFSRVWGLFDERRGYLALADVTGGYVPHGYNPDELREGEPDRGEFGYQFMLTQVAGYKGEVDRNFQTVCLEGKRAANSPAATVHIYDAHYSDLTKPQSNILGFFFAFYQLLFHLASLSLLAVYWVEAEQVRDGALRVREAETAKVEAEKVNKESEHAKKAREEAEKVKKEAKHRILPWRIESFVHASSVRLLTMFVPFLNLVLLAIAVSAFADKTQDKSWLPAVSLGFAAVLGLIATFWLLRIAPSPSRPFLWAGIPLLGAGLGVLILSGLACVYNCRLHFCLSFYETLLLLGWLLAAGFLVGWIGWKFNPLRPGVFALSIFLYAVNLYGFLFCLLPHAARVSGAGHNQVATASLWAVQWIFGELLLSWVFCLLFAFLSWPLSLVCIWWMKNDTGKNDAASRKARAKAAFRTGRFAFAVPAILFSIVTCTLWSGVVVYGSEKLKAFDGVSPSVAKSGAASRWPSIVIPKIDPVELWVKRAKQSDKLPDKPPVCPPPAAATGPSVPPTTSATSQSACPPPAAAGAETGFWTDYLTGLLLVSVTPGLPVTVVIFVFSLLLLAWAVLPSVVFELMPKWAENAVSSRIRSLGEWVSRGLDNTAILTRLLWCAIVPLPLIFFGCDWLVLRGCQRWLGFVHSASKITLPLIHVGGLVLAVSSAAIFTFILKYLTTVLDTILDVDNYLRTSPQDQTPRALVAERCTSLLRYIAAYRDDRGHPYSKVIIVAHSLGSMVTTDLLRYLERSAHDSPDPGLDRYEFRKKTCPDGQTKLPIYVFSMGCPLRQLLNRFFPHLYWWVSDIPDNSDAALGTPLDPPPAIRLPLPRTDEMNVTLWANAYRSGDYVGRWLWVDQWLNRNASGDTTQPPDVAHAGTIAQKCDEMCIGLGAHTHYWDRSAPDIAMQLDKLIT
jgi:hypothetical protein